MKVAAVYLLLFLVLGNFLAQGVISISGGTMLFASKYFLMFWNVLAIIFHLTVLGVYRNEAYRFKVAELGFWGFVFFGSILVLVLKGQAHLLGAFISVYMQCFIVYLFIPMLRAVQVPGIHYHFILKLLEYFGIANVILVTLNYFFPSVIFFGELFDLDYIRRAFGWMGDQVAWIFSFYAAWSAARKKIVLTFVFLFALLLTGSVGALAVAIISIFCIFFREIKSQLRTLTGLVISGVSLIALSVPVFYIASSLYQSRFGGANDGAIMESSSGVHRVIAFFNAFTFWQENWLLGSGFGTYAAIMSKEYSFLEGSGQEISISSMVNANNQILQFLVETGVIGLMFVIILFITLFKELKTHSFKNAFNRAFLLWLAVFIIFNQTATWFLPGSYLYMFFVLGVTLSILFNKDHVEKTTSD